MKLHFFFTLYIMQDSIHESESSVTPVENSQGVAENTTETEVESTMTQTPARF